MCAQSEKKQCVSVCDLKKSQAQKLENGKTSRAGTPASIVCKMFVTVGGKKHTKI